MREHQLVSRHVKFELSYIYSPPKSIACTEQVSYRTEQVSYRRREDLSPRCFAAICRIVCLGLLRSKLLPVRWLQILSIYWRMRDSTACYNIFFAEIYGYVAA